MPADFLLESNNNESFHHAENEEGIEIEHVNVADIKINDFNLIRSESKKKIFHCDGQIGEKTMK